jgi:hypothetical protein
VWFNNYQQSCGVAIRIGVKVTARVVLGAGFTSAAAAGACPWQHDVNPLSQQ